MQIKSNLYARSGKSINNFGHTLPAMQSDLAKSIIKNPYNLEFLDIKENILERELENKLIDNIKDFFIRTRSKFCIYRYQYHIELEGEDYYLYLVFYHVKLKCYVVIELKTVKFKPEYAEKLNFYLNLVDHKIKDETDNPTIGIILCEEKRNITVEYAIESLQKPIGIAQFKLTEEITYEIKKLFT
ncbi:PDDEXK nuclease domain-containing protein [Rickettsia gravesii]|uniref:PDDEXK nuclease domain-containing protein n=1 Tax=Rickettsia gravesii TaxID=354585 RepID=UPI0004B6F41A|nr:PDDEXK nuclease domain-containing protein [Rickettsia gravesii]